MKSVRLHYAWNACLLITGLVILFVGAVTIATHAADVGNWSSPGDIRLRRVGYIAQEQRAPVARPNTDCQQATYRAVNDTTMRTGCFTPSAVGMVESGSQQILFNGTDEAIRIKPYYSSQTWAPWPNAGVMISFQSAPVDGSYIGIYKNFLGALSDERSTSGALQAKALAKGPDHLLVADNGDRIVANVQTIAFSTGGSWMAVQTYQGSFVRINLATLEVTPFARSFPYGTEVGINQSVVAISPTGRFIAIANSAARTFIVYDLDNCQANGATGLKPYTCLSYNYRSFIESQTGDVRYIKHVRFLNDSLVSIDVLGSNKTNDATYVLAPNGNISSMLSYLGVGDSYTSGEGAFNYLSGTDSDNNMCHLSVQSYPLLLARDVFGPGGKSVACSGAVINDLASTSDNYRGQVRAGPSYGDLNQSNPALLKNVLVQFVPGYIAQQHFVGYYQPGITTVSVGGNDIGFGQIIQQCVIPRVSIHKNANSCFSNYEDRLEVTQLIDRTRTRWVGLYKKLRATAPQGKLYAIGYPQITVSDGDCAANVHLDRHELLFAEQLIEYLNGIIAVSAKEAGVEYIDISMALAGHRLCETASYNVAVNGLTSGMDAGVLGVRFLGKESYHPNAFGHYLIEQAILQASNNFKGGAPNDTPTASTNKVLSAPHANRPTTVRMVRHSVPTQITRGETLSISVNGQEFGLRAGSSYTVRFDSLMHSPIHSATTDAEGDLATKLIVPASTPPGAHTLMVTGKGNTDQLISIIEPIYIKHTVEDTDGDGLIDREDACPYSIPSNKDQDVDGVDDSCDAVIDAHPKQTTSEAATTKVNQVFSIKQVLTPDSRQTTAHLQPENLPRAKHETMNNKSAQNPQQEGFTQDENVPVWLISAYPLWAGVGLIDHRLSTVANKQAVGAHKRHTLKR